MSEFTPRYQSIGRFLILLGFAGFIAAYRVPEHVRKVAMVGGLVTLVVGGGLFFLGKPDAGR